MPQTNISIRIDEDLKKQFESLCSELGLTMSTALSIFVKTVVREQGIPFSITLNKLNENTIKAIEDVEKGIGLSKPYNSAEEAVNSMLEED